MEVSVDGVFVVNKNHLEKYIIGDRDARGNIARYKSGPRRGRMSSDSLLQTYEGFYMRYLEEGETMDTAAQQQMRDLRAQIEAFATLDEREFTRADGTKGVRIDARMKDIESLNARIGVGEGPFSFLKGRGRIVENLPDDVSIVIPDIMVKKETGFQEFLNFDVLDGRSTEAVNPDLQMILFHREAFTEFDAEGKAMVPKVTTDYARGQMDELDEVLRTGIVPEKVRERIMQNLDETTRDTFNLTFGKHKAGSRYQNKELARRLNDALISGNVTDPEVVNALTNYYRRQIFDETRTNNKRVRILKTPDLFRFDIEAEVPSLQGQDTPFLLASRADPRDPTKIINKGVDTIEMMATDTTGASITRNVDFSRARVYNHRMLFGGLSSVTHQASLGGFDFDDKGLPTIRSFVDNAGRKRTAFMTFRQPTGPSEFVVQTISKDHHTLNELFGKNDQFKNTLLQIADDDTADATLRTAAGEMHEYMSYNVGKFNEFTDEQANRFAYLHRKFAGIGVTKENIANRELLGTKSSRLFDESFGFFKEAQINIDNVIDAAYNRIHGRGVQEIPERLMNLMAKVGAGGALTLTPEVMREAAATLDESEMKFLAPYYARGQFFRLFGETAPAAFEESERTAIVEGLRRQRAADTALLDRMISKSGDSFDMADQDFRKALAGIVESQLPDSTDSASRAMKKRVALAEIEKGMELYRSRLNFGEAEQSILGSYVNKLMAVGSTVDQMEDIMSDLASRGDPNADKFLKFVRDEVITPFFIPEEAVDFTKTTGGMRVLGATTDAAAASNKNMILKAFALTADAAMTSMDPAQLAKALDELGVKSLDDAGETLMQHLGMRIAIMQAGAEALGISPEELERFGVDPRLFNLKIQGARNAENIGIGIQQGLQKLSDFVDTALDPDAQARFAEARTRLESAVGADFKTLGDLISISSTSKYATASLHLEAADNFNVRLQNANRKSFMSRSAAEIDIFYMNRQGAPIASEVQSEAARIVREAQDQMKAFDEFQRSITMAESAEGFEKAQLEIARANLGEKVRQDITASVERLRAAGMDNLSELDFYDAIQLEERMQKVSHRELATLSEIDPAIPNRLSELKRLSELRREYFGIVGARKFEGSDTQKMHQVVERYLTYLTPEARAKAEEALTQADETQKTIMRIMNIDSPASARRLRGYAPRGRSGVIAPPTLSELTSGIMSEDDFKQIGSLLQTSRSDEAMAAVREAGDEDIIRNISGVQKAAGEVSTLYKARAAGFEDMYLDPSTGRVTIPAITGAADDAASTVTRPIAGQKYKRITQAIADGDLKRLIDKPYVKGTLAGIVALGAFGFIHSARKDHTTEDMTGPPLLPGGSAYESGYPGNTLNLQPKDYPMISGENGVTYRINVSGSNENARRFGDSIGALMPGASSATYYNNIRDLNVDPYKEMGNSF